MGSENTVTSSIPIPNWMKSKLNDKYNLDDSSAFSPPSEDDGFFHIPYPKHNKSTSDFASLNEDENKFISITKALNLNSAESSNNNHGFAKHTVPCQKYLGDRSQ